MIFYLSKRNWSYKIKYNYSINHFSEYFHQWCLLLFPSYSFYGQLSVKFLEELLLFPELSGLCDIEQIRHSWRRKLRQQRRGSTNTMARMYEQRGRFKENWNENALLIRLSKRQLKILWYIMRKGCLENLTLAGYTETKRKTVSKLTNKFV